MSIKFQSRFLILCLSTPLILLGCSSKGPVTTPASRAPSSIACNDPIGVPPDPKCMQQGQWNKSEGQTRIQDFDWSRVSLKLSNQPVTVNREGYGKYVQLYSSEKLFDTLCLPRSKEAHWQETKLTNGYCRMFADETVQRLKAGQNAVPQRIVFGQDLKVEGATVFVT